MKPPFISQLKHALTRAAFWRKQAPVPEEPTATAEIPAPEPEQSAEIPAEPESLAAKPRLIARIMGSLTFWRRRQAAGIEAEAENAEATPAQEPVPPAPDGEAGPETKRPFLKRIFAVLATKWVWIPAGAAALMALGVFTTLLILRGQHAEQDKALRELQAAKAKLERENTTLRTQATIIPGRSAAKPVTVITSAKVDPAFDVVTANSGGTTSGNEAGGDCMVSDKENAGESLRRCIEAFNRATSGSTKKK